MATTQRISSAAARQILAAALVATAKAAGEDYQRDDLPAGAYHKVRLSLAAEIDGEATITREWDGSVEVGHDSVRASSVGVKAGELLAYLVSRMNETTRAATLRDLADVYAAQGRLPVDETEVKAADEALSRLRQKVDQSVRGSVRVSVRQITDEPAAPAATPPAVTVGHGIPIVAATVARKSASPAKQPAKAAASRKTASHARK